MARITYTYRHYPLSEELTEKSKNLAFFTRPLLGVGLGAILWFVPSMAFNVSVSVSNVLMVIGMVGGPIALQIIRAKKFAQYDAEYAKILKEQEKKNTTNKKPVAQQQPAQQQPVYQQPVQQQPAQQQPVYQQPIQQPVYQQPVYQQPIHMETIRGSDGREFHSLEAYIEDALRMTNNFSERDPEVYWACYERLGWLTEVYPNDDRLLAPLSKVCAFYAGLQKIAETLKDSKRVVNLAINALEYGSSVIGVEELNTRKTNLLVHIVNAGIKAGNSSDITWLEESVKWLRMASGICMENPNPRQAQYQNVAVPSVRFYVGYCLARQYMEQNPPQKQRAKAVLEEALQACPYALIRQCDTNPERNADTNTVLYRADLIELLNRASQ